MSSSSAEKAAPTRSRTRTPGRMWSTSNEPATKRQACIDDYSSLLTDPTSLTYATYPTYSTYLTHPTYPTSPTYPT